MNTEQQDLVERVRTALPADREVREVKMFGGLSFMLEDRMVVAARTGGDLLVRIDPDRSEELLARPGAYQAMMGSDRPMGPGWLAVEHDQLGTDEQLAFWIQVGLDHHAAG